MCLQVGLKSLCSGVALGYGSSFVKRMQALLDYLGLGLCPHLVVHRYLKVGATFWTVGRFASLGERMGKYRLYLGLIVKELI